MSERQLMRPKKDKPLKGRRLVAVKNDPLAVAYLYDLLLERDPSVNISHKEVPSFEDHAHFVARCPYRVWYLIYEDAVCLGSIYLTVRNELGIFIFKAHQGKGVASWAVQKIIKRFRHALNQRRSDVRHGFIANIAPENRESQVFFQKQGFVLVQYTYFLDVEYPSRAAAMV